MLAFAIGNLAKLPGYWAIGMFEDLDGALAAAGIAGTAVGRQIVRILPDATYRRVLEWLLLLLSVLLLARGLTAI